eukprot:1718595-Rhodomonas_salina.2
MSGSRKLRLGKLPSEMDPPLCSIHARASTARTCGELRRQLPTLALAQLKRRQPGARHSECGS